MNKVLKRVLIIAGCIIAAGLLMHLAGAYLFPFIARMHGGGAY
jgi:hypothetical protein